MSNVTLNNIKKAYGPTVVVHDFNLDIDDKEFVVLVGYSGCGKSTTLRMIAGLEEITDGELQIGSSRVNEKAPGDRGVAMVFQDYALYPHMTVYENMALLSALKKLAEEEIDSRVKEAAHMLDLDPFLERKPAALSGGQRQRVAMGRAVVKKADVFLFDEPLSNLDAKLRTKMRSEIKKFHAKAKTTTVYVTHDQLEAMTLADRLVVMKDGMVEQAGTPLEVFDCPKSVFVATFIGSPQMNILPFNVENGMISAEGGSFSFEVPEDKKTLLNGHNKILMGVRPSDLYLADNTDEKWAVEGEVEIVELLW